MNKDLTEIRVVRKSNLPPVAGLNHAVFGQFAVLKNSFEPGEPIEGELWFGHTGRASLYLNGGSTRTARITGITEANSLFSQTR